MSVVKLDPQHSCSWRLTAPDLVWWRITPDFFTKTNTNSVFFPLSLTVSLRFLVWTTASYLWMMSMWGRWHTAKLWRPLRRQVLSSASMSSAENQQQRKSPKSNSSKGLKVCGSVDWCTASTPLCGLKDALYPAKLCPLDLANLLCVNPTSFAHSLPLSSLPFLRIRFQHCWRGGKPAHTRR